MIKYKTMTLSKMETSQETQVVTKEVLPLVRLSNELQIDSKESLAKSVGYLSQLNKLRDAWVENKEQLTKPINEALKEIKARYSPVEKMLDEAISHVRNEQSVYHTQEIKRQKEEEEKIASRVGEGKGKIKIETAIRKMDEVSKVAQSVSSVDGSVKFRTTQVLKVIDKSIIPFQYFELNESAALRDLKAGVAVPGCILEDKSIPINYR